MTDHDQFFYGGQWQKPLDRGDRIEVVSPNDGEVLGSCAAPGRADVDAAVAAARAAFDDPRGWPSWPASERAAAMERLAAILEIRGEELATLVSSQNGMPISQSLAAEATTGPGLLRYYANLIRAQDVEELRDADGRDLIVRSEPVGVVASIVPWNFPMSLAFMKIAPLMAAGCTTVLKPSQETVLDSFVLAECVAEAGLPPGVLNILPGDRELGAYLVEHPGIDKVTFTGSTRGGRQVARRCGELLRPVSLELGGKSAGIVLEDADLLAHRDDFLASTMFNNGQTCWLSTRILVPSSRATELLDTITDLVASQVVGSSLEQQTEIGPMSTAGHRDRVEGFLQRGLQQGARVTTGGGRPAGWEQGWFVEPTVLADLDNTADVAREEIFGPVLCVIPYRDVEDAIAIANDSEYGLGGTVWTADEQRGIEMARRVRTGTVGINSYAPDPRAPIGGVRRSGFGREMGPEGLAEYQSLKSIFPHP